jgi:mannose-6-phosphate isomerase-like protein (cupin superfamily)
MADNIERRRRQVMPDRHDKPAGSTLQIITYDDGIDTEEEWSQSWEGKNHGVGISLIHLSTTKDDDGPPLHLHPYPETIMVRRGTSTVTVGEQQLEGNAGQTVVIPPNTPHTFRTHGPQRYESIAIHSSPAFLSTRIDDDADER